MARFVWFLLVAFWCANIYFCEGQTREKRELSEENAKIMETMKKELQELAENLKRSNCGSKNRGDGIYTRWGKSSCERGSELVYEGQAAGGHYHHSGAAVNYLCLPTNSSYNKFDPRSNSAASLFAAQYHIYYNYDKGNNKGSVFDYGKYNAKGVPCAVCLATSRPAVVMVPGTQECFNRMHKEYSGYLMAGDLNNPAGSEYVCVDENADTITVSKLVWHKFFNPVESTCDGSLNCKTYKNNLEVTCVVCSK